MSITHGARVHTILVSQFLIRTLHVSFDRNSTSFVNVSKSTSLSTVVDSSFFTFAITILTVFIAPVNLILRSRGVRLLASPNNACYHFLFFLHILGILANPSFLYFCWSISWAVFSIHEWISPGILRPSFYVRARIGNLVFLFPLRPSFCVALFCLAVAL